MQNDYYSILEAWPKSSADEIKKNYFRLAKLYHPDVAGNTLASKERFKLINEAYGVLIDPQKRREYDETLMKKVGSKDAAALKASDRKTATLAYQQARDAIKAGRYDKASVLLREAIRADGTNPSYHSWYGFSLAMNGGNLHEARDACKKAIEMEFYSADYHANLGFVYFKAGLKNLAVKHFSDALKWDPKNPVASKFMSKASGGDRGQGPIDRLFSGLKKSIGIS